ncbi:MAG: GDSL-type esterase/lipase family protein [bacterium]
MEKIYTLNNLKKISQKINLLSENNLIFFGDSITADSCGFVNIIKQLFFEISHLNKIKIINAGVSGDTTVHALKRIENDVISKNPNKVFLMLGVNDSCIRFSEQVQLVSLKYYCQNLTIICNLIKKETNAKIILMTPTIVIGSLVKHFVWEKIIDEYAQTVKEIAKKEKLEMIDIFASFEKYKNKSKLFIEDGVHPNILGHRVIAYEILSFLSKNR